MSNDFKNNFFVQTLLIFLLTDFSFKENTKKKKKKKNFQ